MRIIAFTGAGISKESGIDTFQDRPGIREKLTRTYATNHPEDFRKIMEEFVSTMEGKEPNDAHIALAENKIPIITMNVDGLHQKAGSTKVIAVHGDLPTKEELPYCEKLIGKPVLYEDAAPRYQQAFNLISDYGPEDVLLVIGASTYTGFSVDIRMHAEMYGLSIVEIQRNAAKNVRNCINELKLGEHPYYLNNKYKGEDNA